MMKKTLTTLMLLLTLSFLRAEEIPQSMASVGDSITAAALGRYTIKSWYNPLAYLELIRNLFRFGRERDVGHFEDRELSWSTGLDGDITVLSHAHRLKSLNQNLNREFLAFNAAVSGSTSESTLEQIETVFDWSQEKLGQGAPDYLTVLTGPNDICTDKLEEMTTAEDYKENIGSMLHKVFQQNAETKVLLVELPNIESVYSLAKDHRLMQFANLGRCQDVWRSSNLCNTLLTLEDSRDREMIKNRIQQYNLALQELAQSFQMEQGKDSVRYAGELHRYRFKKEDLSIDCFHPNYRSQNTLAEIAWKSSWWSSQGNGFDELRSKQKETLHILKQKQAQSEQEPLRSL